MISAPSNGGYSAYLQHAAFPAEAVYERQTLLRIERLCRRAVSAMAIDLSGMTILTEAATGPFATTAVIAALAGAEQVRAVTRDSRYGASGEAIAQVRTLAAHCGVEQRITFSTEAAHAAADACDIVTNLGFVRPIDRAILSRLSDVAAVALMWEPWEFRPDEIDCAALDEHSVALIATNEHHPEVRTFEYLGPTVGRMLLDVGVEIVNAQLLVVGSDPFGSAIAQWLSASGAHVSRGSATEPFPTPLDALVLAEHRGDDLRIGSDPALLEALAEAGAPIVRLCGSVDAGALIEPGVALYPPTQVGPGVMTLTTAYAGPRPVIDLHAASLKAAGDVVKARREGASIAAAIAGAVASGYGLAVDRP